MNCQRLGCVTGSALAVWYLLQAPLAPGPYPATFEAYTVVMDTLPWKEWEFEGSFPTLEACETARKQRRYCKINLVCVNSLARR